MHTSTSFGISTSRYLLELRHEICCRKRLRHKALGFTWNMPAFGEEVGMWRSQDKKLIKSANNRGAIGRLIEVTPWQNGTTSLIAKGSDLQDPEMIQGLQPKTVAVECLRLSEPRTIPEGWTKSALDVFARDWTSIVTPEGKDLWIQLKTGKAQYSSPFMAEFADAKTVDSFAYWGDVNEAGNDLSSPGSTRLCVSNTSA